MSNDNPKPVAILSCEDAEARFGKGHWLTDLLCAHFNRVAETHPDWPVFVVGCPPEEELATTRRDVPVWLTKPDIIAEALAEIEAKARSRSLSKRTLG